MIIRATGLFFMLIGSTEAALIVENYKPTLTVKNPYNGNLDKTSSISMPLFVGKGKDKKVAARINEFIYLTQLGRQPPLKVSEPISDVWDSYDSYSYEVLRNDEKIIAVNIRMEGCRASCSTNNDHYNFDAKTGQFIHVSSLFTHNGLKQVSSKLVKEWSKTIHNDAPNYDLQEEQVNECISNMQTNYDKKTPYLGYDFVINKNTLDFVGAYCTKMVSSYPVSLSYKEIYVYLSNYGKSLFSTKATINQPIHPYGQLFDGLIADRYNIKMILLEPYPSAGYLDGYYLYTQYNKPIKVFGEYVNGTLTIQELNEESQPTGSKMTVSPYKNGFTGYWEGNNKKFKVILKIE